MILDPREMSYQEDEGYFGSDDKQENLISI